MAIERVTKIDGEVRIRNIIVSTADKAGLDSFVPSLIELLPDALFYSTGGTYSYLRTVIDPLIDEGRAGAATLRTVSEYTGQPEMRGGLVKTLDFRIYLGILSETYNESHQADLERTHAAYFDMVVANLYPFETVVASASSDGEDARGNIDIGGPCMLRAAAKNYLRVMPVSDPDDYPSIISELTETSGLSRLKTRFGLAKKAFEQTARYDHAIAEYFKRTPFEEIESLYEDGEQGE